MVGRYRELERSDLATLVPELLLIGQLIDRSGMAWCIQALGREQMLQVAIEEWMAASPIYTKRMQRALNFEGPTCRPSSKDCSSTSARRRSSWTSATTSPTPTTAPSTWTTAAR